MHKKSKQQSIATPLIDLITFRSKIIINKDSLDQNLLKYFSLIPYLENKEITKLNKSKTSSEAFHNAAPKCKFDYSILTLLTMTEIKPQNNDSVTVIFCYNFFAWLYLDSKKGDNESIIHLFVKCLLRINNNSIQTVINYIFGEILGYISNNSAFTFQDNFCSDIIRYFETNLTLDSSLFPQFIYVVKKLFNSEKFTPEALIMIDNLVTKKSTILEVPDSEPLIIILQPHIQSLNTNALHALSLLSKQAATKSSRLSDSFVLIINSIVQNITTSEPFHVIKLPSDSFNTYLNIAQKEIIPHEFDDLTFLPDLQFNSLFTEPPFYIFNSKKPLSSFMSPKNRGICRMVSACIKNSNSFCKVNFAKMFLSHLQITESTKVDAFAELAASFFTLSKDFSSKELCQDSILPTLAKSVIFNNSLHVFLDEQLDPAINSFRESFLELIHAYCPGDIFDFLKQIKSKRSDYIFLFVEMLARILNHKKWFPLRMIQNNFYISLMEISRGLQSMNLKYSSNAEKLNVVTRARNSLMVFISDILVDPFTSVSYFSSQTFIHGFFWLIFEPSLTSTVLHTISGCISKMKEESVNQSTFMKFMNFTGAALNSCKKNYNNDVKYKELAKAISNELIDALYQRPFFTHFFIPILLSFLEYLVEFPDKDILSNSLIYLNLYASSNAQFELSDFLFKLFYKAIKSVEGNEISIHTENMLFSLLRKSVCCESEELFFIMVPSALPLILSTFGNYESGSEKFIKLIFNLCSYSDYNKVMCNNGEIDLILIQYACLKTNKNRNVTIKYHGCEFSLIFSNNAFKNYVLPLISMISSIKSENADANYLIEHLIHSENQEICFFLTQLVSKRQKIPKPLFSLGSSFTQFHVDGIHAVDLESNGFTLTFMLNVDKEYIKDKEKNISIMSFKDTNNISFTIYLSQVSLFAKQESETAITMVNVVKNIPGSTWVNVTLAVSFSSESVTISNYMNNKKLPDSELSPFSFSPGEVKITVGGLDNNNNTGENLQEDWKNQQYALFGGIKLIKGALSPDEIIKLNGENSSQILFDSSIIKEPCCETTYSKPRDGIVNTGLFGKSVTDIVINVHSAPPAPLSLVDILVNRHDCCQLANYFNFLSSVTKDEDNQINSSFCGYPSMIIGLIKELFKKDIECQIYFNQSHINIILKNLHENPEILNANLYYAFYDVLKVITYQPLIKPWLESFILNAWLWSKCNYEDYYDIIIHYSHVLIVNYKNMFKDNSYFSSLFNQTMLLFALDDEGHPETSISDVPPLLNSTYDEKAILHCQDLFFVFLARIGTINLNETDVASLLAHISEWKTKSTLIKLLKMVYDISATLINVEGYEENCIPCIQSLIYLNDVDIINHALLILPELVKEKTMNYLIRAAFYVIKSENKEQIFNSMIGNLIRSPSQYLFLSILSLDIKGDSSEKFSKELDKIVFDSNSSFKIKNPLPQMWFLFPLLLALQSDDVSMEKICRFIAFVLVKESIGDFSNHCNMLFAFIEIISAVTKKWNSKVPLYLLKYLFNTTIKEKMTCVAQNAIFISLFRTFNFENKSVLDDEFKRSKFYDSSKSADEIKTNQSNSPSSEEFKDPIFMLNYLATTNLKPLLKIKFVLELENTEKGAYKVKSEISTLLEFAHKLMIKTKSFPENEIKVIKHFFQLMSKTTKTPYKKDSSSPMFEADEILDKYQKLYKERLSASVLLGQKDLQSIANFVKQKPAINDNKATSISESQMKAEYKCHIHSFLNPDEEVNKKRNMFDQTLCSFFCPFKIKSIKQPNRPFEKTEFAETLFEHSALLLSFNRKPLPVSFRLNKKNILILANSKNKKIPLSSILYVFSRCQGNGLEFICLNGKSYLLNFQADISQIYKALNSVKMPNCSLFIHNELMSPSSLQKRWLIEQFSNFDYLLRINMIAGRSFRDRSAFPIFPSILKDIDDINSVKESFDTLKIPEGKGEIKVDFSKGIRESFNEFDFVRADYFFRPESIDYIPQSWAKTEFDVVYKLREILESPQITNILHKWINNCFKKYSSRFLNIQTFRYEHLQHPTASMSNKSLSIIKKINISNSAITGNIIAATPLSNQIYLLLSSSGTAYYLSLNNKNESQMSTSIDSLLNPKTDDLDINYTDLLVNQTTSATSTSSSASANNSVASSSPTASNGISSVYSALSSNAGNPANLITASIVSSFKAQELFFPFYSDEETSGNSILNLNTIPLATEESSNSSIAGSSGNFNRRSNDNFQSDPESSFKRSSVSTSYINPVSSISSFDSFGSFAGIGNFNILPNAFQDCLLPTASFGFTRGKIAYYTPEDNKIHLIGNEKVINEAVVFPELPFVACCVNDIFFCSDPCTISAVSPSQPPCRICSTTSRISALVADEIFQVIVVGTKDCCLHIFRAQNGSLVKSIDLAGNKNLDYEKGYNEILKILITSKWGLIIVNIVGKILVFNINGIPVNEIELNKPILKWFTYSNNQSFDFVVFENNEHKIGFFDPIKSNSVQYFYEIMEPVPLINFIPSINSFVFLSDNKQITLVPHP